MERKNEFHGRGRYFMIREKILNRKEIYGLLSFLYKEEQLNKMSNEELRLFYNIHFRDKVSEVSYDKR